MYTNSLYTCPSVVSLSLSLSLSLPLSLSLSLCVLYIAFQVLVFSGSSQLYFNAVTVYVVYPCVICSIVLIFHLYFHRAMWPDRNRKYGSQTSCFVLSALFPHVSVFCHTFRSRVGPNLYCCFLGLHRSCSGTEGANKSTKRDTDTHAAYQSIWLPNITCTERS